MSKGLEQFNWFFEEFEAAGVDFTRMNASDLGNIRQVCEASATSLWLMDYRQLRSEFLNDYGRQYFGLDALQMKAFSFGTLMDITHPDDVQKYKGIFIHFQQTPGSDLTHCVRLKNAGGEYRWTYIVQRAVSFDPEGAPIYILSMIIDIEDALNNSVKTINGGYLEKLERYETLTAREKEILDLVAAEYTSQEIADGLFIETSTVDTHRKHILRKLQVKSSLGLVEYSLFYSDPAVKLRKVL